MTTANKVTILRILLIPLFVVAVLYYVDTGNEKFRLAALVAFLVAAVCDGVDGFIARHYHQVSELGKLLDPLADKLLLVSGVVLLSMNHGPRLERLPLWLVATILSRDVLLLIGLGVMHLVRGKMDIVPRISGKIATVFQMATVVWALLKWDAQWLFLLTLGAALFTGVSGLFYGWDWMRQMSTHPTSLATVKK
ncbi:MAG TPA: CDP-alcohol phosphatidyltransferase family protein [Dongiaceae bacterium]|nr:CDP-alcohol phosphatidyltransferase family protein [Dongiaceae bacterium]